MKKISVIFALLFSISLSGQNTEDLLLEGTRLMKDTLYDQALEKFNAVLKRSRYDADALKYKSLCLKWKGDLQGAVATLDKAVQSSPGEPFLYMLRGDIYREMDGHHEQAVASYKKVVELDSANTKAPLQLGALMYARGVKEKSESKKQNACTYWTKAESMGSEAASELVNTYCTKKEKAEDKADTEQNKN